MFSVAAVVVMATVMHIGISRVGRRVTVLDAVSDVVSDAVSCSL